MKRRTPISQSGKQNLQDETDTFSKVQFKNSKDKDLTAVAFWRVLVFFVSDNFIRDVVREVAGQLSGRHYDLM